MVSYPPPRHPPPDPHELDSWVNQMVGYRVGQAIPGRTSIRNGLQPLEIDELEQPIDSAESQVIMVDHSNRIGSENVIPALGVPRRRPSPDKH